MAIFWMIIELLSTAFETTVILNFFNNTADCKFCEKKKNIIVVLFVFIITFEVSILNQFYVFESWLAIITIAITAVYTFIMLKRTLIYKIIMPIIAYSIMLIINILVTYALSAVFGVSETFIFSENDGARLIALFLTKLLFYLTMKLMTSIFRKESIDLGNKEAASSIIMSLITFIIAIALVKIQIETQLNNGSIFICILGILLMDIFIIYIIKRLTEENRKNFKIAMLELQLSEQKSLIEDAGSINTEIKKTEHDLRHHLFTVLGIIKSGDLQAAEMYLKKLTHKFETSIFKYIVIDNSAINSIINIKIGRCHKENIDIKIEIESDFNDYNDIDICVLLANLFDNAIEASSKVKEPYIEVTIKNEKNYLCIIVKNKIDNSVIKWNKSLKTTKSDKSKHGLGLYSISQIVEKYNGIKSYYEKNGCFVADIWLKRNIYSLPERIKSEANYQTRQK